MLLGPKTYKTFTYSFHVIHSRVNQFGIFGTDAGNDIRESEILISDISADILYIIFWMWLSNMCDKDM